MLQLKKNSCNCIFIKYDTDKFSLHKCIVYILVKSICIKTRSKFISEEYIFNFISQFLALKHFPRWNYGFIASFKYTIETNLISSTIFFFFTCDNLMSFNYTPPFFLIIVSCIKYARSCCFTDLDISWYHRNSN